MARTRSEDVEARILTAATEVLDEVGSGELTQRVVATRAGVSPQSIYNRFESKHDLLDAIADAEFRRLEDFLRGADGVPLSSYADPLDNVVEGMRRYRRFAIDHPHRYGLMFDAPVPGFAISDRTLGSAFSSLGVLIEAASGAIDAGRIRPMDPVRAAQMVWGAAHGALRFELADIALVEDRAAYYDELVTAVLRGLATDPA